MAVPSVTRQTFLANLRQSGLLSAEQLEAAAQTQPEITRGRLVARTLVAQGVLTKFQAEQLLAGRTSGFFLGPYRILDQLGQGGMGRVYKAQHRTLGRIVALKALAPCTLKSTRAQDLFLREVRAIAQVVHPNIVTAFDADRAANGRYYLVMEYVNGPNLDQLVREQGPLAVGQACAFLRQVALGLQHAHERGLIHRDIKPANLLLQPAGNGGQTAGLVKISDFGLARLGEPTDVPENSPGTILLKQNRVLGTPDYLSPEQARDLHGTDIRADLYSLGCTFYFLLTGQVPFPGGSTLEKLIRHGTEEPVPVERLRPDVPPAVASIVRRLMAKKPEDRFQTAAEVAAAVTPFAADNPGTWSRGEPGGPFADPLPTPDAGAGPISDAGLDLSATAGEAQALVGTLPLAPAVTPHPLRAALSSVRLADALRARQRRRAALLWALGIVGAVAATAATLALFVPR
jgi:serine/threonine-protein kinase